MEFHGDLNGISWGPLAICFYSLVEFHGDLNYKFLIFAKIFAIFKHFFTFLGYFSLFYTEFDGDLNGI